MVRKQFSANIPASEQMLLVGNVANNSWKFKQNFLNYSITSRLSREPNLSYQTSVSLSTILEEAYDIYDGLKFDREEDKMKLDILIFKKMRNFSLVKRTKPTNLTNSTAGSNNY